VKAIQHIDHKNIDFARWNYCIEQSHYNNFCASSQWLNIVCPNWNALILGDYEAVMPLPQKQKLGIYYVYRPVLTPQLGVYAGEVVSASLLQAFIQAIPKKYRYIDFPLNIVNHEVLGLGQQEKGITHHLALSSNYNTLFGAFNQNTRRNIAKAHKYLLTCRISDSFSDIANCIEASDEQWISNMSKSYRDEMLQKLNILHQNQLVRLYVVENESGKVVSVAAFASNSQFLVYVFGISTEEGKQTRAMFCLFNHLIGQFASEALILDFEGSSIVSVAQFFRGFGAIPIEYPKLKLNRLPSGIQFLKK